MRHPIHHRKGRGAVNAPDGRFVKRSVQLDDDVAHERSLDARQTILKAMRAGRIISSNNSPDIPFNRSINPYQGCEHGCIYCYARPSHSYLDLSPGLDFETRIFYKPNAAARLEEEWTKPRYECEPIMIGANTDPYQPAEKKFHITRDLLELFRKHRHPVSLITKSNLIARDVDLLAELATKNLCSVTLSLPTLKRSLKRIMEPRVPSAESRLKTMELLVRHKIPVSVLVAPLIPVINDDEIEAILAACAAAGAARAHYVFLRLPHEVRDLFVDWLSAHYPDRAARVMSLVRQASAGRDYDARPGLRQTGQGPYADMLKTRFRTACRRLGLSSDRYQAQLDCALFEPPGQRQLGLDF